MEHREIRFVIVNARLASGNTGKHHKIVKGVRDFFVSDIDTSIEAFLVKPAAIREKQVRGAHFG